MSYTFEETILKQVILEGEQFLEGRVEEKRVLIKEPDIEFCILQAALLMPTTRQACQSTPDL